MPISNPGKNLFAPVALAWTAFCASPSVAQMSALDILFLDSYFEIIIAEQELPGMAVAVTSGEEIVHLAGDGEAREGEPATPDTQFYIASVSKSFTALAIMQLVEAGAVDLDAPVVQYLPSFRTARDGHAEKVTVRHLLNQTSGLSYDGFPPIPPHAQPASIIDLVALMQDVAPRSEAGEKFHYFDPNYGIAAQLVEVVGGKPFGALLERMVFSPLHMHDSFAVVRAEDAPHEADALAQGYRPTGSELTPVDEKGYVGGSGGVVSTARDLAKYLILHTLGGVFDNQVLVSSRTVKALRTPPNDVESPYAMGWVVEEPEASPLVVTNWGDLASYHTDLVLIPEEELGIALLYNATAEPAVFEDIRAGLIELLTQQVE